MVVGVRLGLSVRQATIEPVNGNVGGIEWEDDPRPAAVSLRVRAVTLVAGPLAQAQVTGITDWDRGWAGDHQGIQQAWFGLSLFGSAPEWEVFFADIQREAAALLTTGHRARTAVAAALLTDRRLPGDRVHAIIDENPGESSNDA
ncbi:MAG TPA: hypothetical protein VG370_02760 [Chloroflexota bacterium]|nr:hypothetical protein [Chloroflexota bacterium]